MLLRLAGISNLVRNAVEELKSEEDRLKKQYSTKMEDLVICCRRFPFAGKLILNNLENQSLARSKETNRGINKFLENERFYWIRILKKYSKNFKGFGELYCGMSL